MDVGSILEGGFTFVIRRPKLVAVWAAINAVLGTAATVAVLPVTTAMANMRRHVIAASTARTPLPPPTMDPLPGSFWLLFAITYVVILLAWVIAFAAVVRAVVHPDRDRFAYLRLGKDELRLIGLGILLAVLGIIAEFVVILLVAAIVGGLAALVGKAASIVAAVICVFLILGIAIYVEVRLSLAGALTIIRERIVLREAWRVTRGSFWTLFAVYLVIGVTTVVVTMVVTAAFNPQMLGAYASMNPHGLAAAAQQRLAEQSNGISSMLIVQSALGGVVNTVLGVIAFAAIATAALEAIHRDQPASEFA